VVSFAGGQVNIMRDAHGFILSGTEVSRHSSEGKGWKLERTPYLLETSIPGVFVAGDVRTGSVKRVASAVGEGSAAVMFVHQYLSTE
jgi:thioredoxin reductase (NADPH)